MKLFKWIGFILLFLVLLWGAKSGYQALSERYVPESPTGSEKFKAQAQQAPDFTVFNEEGEQVSLSDYKGTPVIVNFWATWCGPCQSELPAFDKIAEEYEGQVEVLMVNLTDGQRDTVEGVRSFVQENDYHFPLFFDAKYSAANAYHVYSIPMTVVIDAQGRLMDSHTGALEETSLRAYAAKLLEDAQ